MGREIVQFLSVPAQDTDKSTDAQFGRPYLQSGSSYLQPGYIYVYIYIYIFPDLSRFCGINPSSFFLSRAFARVHMRIYMGEREGKYPNEYERISRADICIDDNCSVTRILRWLLMGEICFAHCLRAISNLLKPLHIVSAYGRIVRMYPYTRRQRARGNVTRRRFNIHLNYPSPIVLLK